MLGLDTDLKLHFSLKSPTLPSPIEDRLPPPASGKFTRAAALVDFDISKQKSIVGGRQCFDLENV